MTDELLPRLTPTSMNDAQRALYERLAAGPRGNGPFPIQERDGSLNGPFGLMLQAPSVGEALSALGEAIRFESSLDTRTREIAILTVGAATRSPYECWAHERVARSVGMSDDEVAALLAGDDWPTASATDLVVRDVARRVSSGGAVPRPLAERLVAAVGAAGAVEVMTLAGYYVLLAQMMAAFGIDAPDGTAPAD